MPANKAGGGLFAKYGAGLMKSHEKHKNETAMPGEGTGQLPPGIEFGIARLVDIKFGIYKSGDNKDEYFFMAAGTVLSPKTHTMEDGTKVKIEGLRTQIGPEPMCDTPKAGGKRKTQDDHYQWVLMQLRGLGVDTKDFDPSQLEDVAAALKEQKPTFKFRTWAGKPATEGPYAGKPALTQHTWMGVTEYNDPDGGNDDVADNSAATSAPAPAPAKGAAKPAASTAKPTPVKWETETNLDKLLAKANEGGADNPAHDRIGVIAAELGIEAEVGEAPDWDAGIELIKVAQAGGGGEEAAAGDEGEDLLALAAKADEQDEEAAATLTARATEAGVDVDAYPNLTWVEFVEQHLSGAPAETPSEIVPDKVGDVFFYRPLDKKTGKKAAKATEHEVTAIDKKAKTVTLKNLANVKLSYPNVPWSDLEEGT